MLPERSRPKRVLRSLAMRTSTANAATPVADNSAPYVLAWRLGGRRVVVVGAGQIGTAKIETLLESGARIVAVDPTPSARVEELAAILLVRRSWLRRPVFQEPTGRFVAPLGPSVRS